MPPATACSFCAAFHEAVVGFRGEEFRELKRKGLRHSYVTGRLPKRTQAVVVSPTFADYFLDVCQGWLGHLRALDSYRARRLHLDTLPGWLSETVDVVDFRRFENVPADEFRPGHFMAGLDVSRQVAARILGVDVRSFYRLRERPRGLVGETVGESAGNSAKADGARRMSRVEKFRLTHGVSRSKRNKR